MAESVELVRTAVAGYVLLVAGAVGHHVLQPGTVHDSCSAAWAGCGLLQWTGRASVGQVVAVVHAAVVAASAVGPAGAVGPADAAAVVAVGAAGAVGPADVAASVAVGPAGAVGPADVAAAVAVGPAGAVGPADVAAAVAVGPAGAVGPVGAVGPRLSPAAAVVQLAASWLRLNGCGPGVSCSWG